MKMFILNFHGRVCRTSAGITTQQRQNRESGYEHQRNTRFFSGRKEIVMLDWFPSPKTPIIGVILIVELIILLIIINSKVAYSSNEELSVIGIKGQRKLLVGILWVIGGTVASAISYFIAYTTVATNWQLYYYRVFIGPIIWGLIEIDRGIRMRMKPERFLSDYKPSEKERRQNKVQRIFAITTMVIIVIVISGLL